MLIYVAGKYSADTPEQIEENVQRAIEVGQAIMLLGHSVVCCQSMTHKWDIGTGLTYDDFMRNCLDLLERCDAICLLEGWEDSPGARIEYAVANRLNMPVYYSGAAPLMDESLTERFWAKVKKRGKNECWEWLGCTNGSYGLFHINRRPIYAHRFSWAIANGFTPGTGIQICHHCDNPTCVNPAHLFSGTRSDNMRDMCMKGRHRDASGTHNGRAKLTEEKVREILQHPHISSSEWSRKTGVSPSVISRIRSGDAWPHVRIEMDE